MSFPRVLVAALFLSSLPAFTQDRQPVSLAPTRNAVQTPATPPPATPSEPWRIIPKTNKDNPSVFSTPDIGSGVLALSPGERLDADTTCYAIRAYVVARDSKDSDSTHPVRYSTCLPASRYRLKTADGKASDR